MFRVIPVIRKRRRNHRHKYTAAAVTEKEREKEKEVARKERRPLKRAGSASD